MLPSTKMLKYDDRIMGYSGVQHNTTEKVNKGFLFHQFYCYQVAP